MTYRRTRIKMCGITRREDAEEGVRAGVDALGFIFVANSPRCIEPERVRAIVADLPPFIHLVGVFVDSERDDVRRIVEYCGLSQVQLHGRETPAYCRELASAVPRCKIIKAFRVGAHSVSGDFSPYREVVQGFLLDTHTADRLGGTGMTFDWDIIGSLALARPVILAGGLTAENVGAAINRVQPFAIDINSGVEVRPGVKDHAKLLTLIKEVQQADSARLG